MDKISEAKIVPTDTGKKPAGNGWYILNAAESNWFKNEKFGMVCTFEGDARFQDYGVNIHVIWPGQPNCHYHGEDNQENFLVLAGECKLLIEGQERLLKQWDFVHCPKWTRHVFVGVGDAPCAILMIGARQNNNLIYPREEVAIKHDAAAPKETTSPRESYADCLKWKVVKGEWPVMGIQT